MRISRLWGLALSLGALSLASQACESKPRQTDHEASKVPVVTEPATDTVAARDSQPVTPASQTVGRWRGERTCIELFANGDVEISLHSAQPKVLVMGRAEISERSDTGFRVAVSNIKIWKGRYLSSCRKVHETGSFADRINVLGTALEKDGSSSFTMKKVSADAWELCGERCERLVPDERLLGATWRRPNPDAREPGSQFARSSEFSGALGERWRPGDLLELKLNEGRQHVWIGGSGPKPIEVAVTVKVRFDVEDQFILEATPDPAAEGQAPARVLGVAVQTGAPFTLRARRLVNQELEVCGDEGHCQTLERQFDGYSYGLR